MAVSGKHLENASYLKTRNEQLTYKTKTTARNWELRDQGFSQSSVILKTLKWTENGCDIKNLFLHPCWRQRIYFFTLVSRLGMELFCLID